MRGRCAKCGRRVHPGIRLKFPVSAAYFSFRPLGSLRHLSPRPKWGLRESWARPQLRTLSIRFSYWWVGARAILITPELPRRPRACAAYAYGAARIRTPRCHPWPVGKQWWQAHRIFTPDPAYTGQRTSRSTGGLEVRAVTRVGSGGAETGQAGVIAGTSSHHARTRACILSARSQHARDLNHGHHTAAYLACGWDAMYSTASVMERILSASRSGISIANSS